MTDSSRRLTFALVAIAGLLLASQVALREFAAGNAGWGAAFVAGVAAVVLYWVVGAVQSRRRRV